MVWSAQEWKGWYFKSGTYTPSEGVFVRGIYTKTSILWIWREQIITECVLGGLFLSYSIISSSKKFFCIITAQ